MLPVPSVPNMSNDLRILGTGAHDHLPREAPAFLAVLIFIEKEHNVCCVLPAVCGILKSVSGGRKLIDISIKLADAVWPL